MKKNIDTEEAMIRWDSFAESYAANHSDQGDAHKEVLLNPTLFSLMGTVEHKKVLDAGVVKDISVGC